MNLQVKQTDPGTLLAEMRGDVDRRLERAAREPAPVGAAARRVAKHFVEHTQKEQHLLEPLLGLLHDAAQGRIDGRMADALPALAELEQVVPGMIADHDAIRAELQALGEAGRAAGSAEIGELAACMGALLRMEEAVAYPAARLLGRYLRMRFGAG